MGFESRFDRALEQSRRRENEQTVNKLDAAAELLTPKLSEFATSPDHSADVEADERYVQGTESRFDQDPSYHAKGLEHFFQFGIGQGRLLSDPSENNLYETEQTWVTRFDDLRNRIDAAATVHVFKDGSPDHREHAITFGIDLTTNPDPSVIRRKILVGSNDPSVDFPVGFSQIKYYRDRNGFRGRRTCIPRYCIGMSSESTDDMLDGVSVSGGQIHIKPGTEAVPAFKILYEMSKQNGLFETPLYRKDDDGTITEEEAQALADISILDGVYIRELSRIAKQLPAWAREGCEKSNGVIVIDKVAEKFMQGDERDETFATIVAVCQELSDRCDQSSDPDWLKKASERLRRPPAQANQRRGHAAYTVAYRAGGPR